MILNFLNLNLYVNIQYGLNPEPYLLKMHCQKRTLIFNKSFGHIAEGSCKYSRFFFILSICFLRLYKLVFVTKKTRVPLKGPKLYIFCRSLIKLIKLSDPYCGTHFQVYTKKHFTWGTTMTVYKEPSKMKETCTMLINFLYT
jgi:hypothetical protein